MISAIIFSRFEMSNLRKTSNKSNQNQEKNKIVQIAGCILTTVILRELLESRVLTDRLMGEH